jgi:hypothetical protein
MPPENITAQRTGGQVLGGESEKGEDLIGVGYR